MTNDQPILLNACYGQVHNGLEATPHLYSAVSHWTDLEQSPTHTGKPETAQLGPIRKAGGRLPDEARLLLAQAVGSGADIDISDPAFDFVRSIKTYDVRYRGETRSRDGCNADASDSTRIGEYGPQGEFAWRRYSYHATPSWIIKRNGSCGRASNRGVGVEWYDFDGTHGYEWVSY